MRYYIIRNENTLEVISAEFAQQPENSLPYFVNEFHKPMFDKYPNPTAVIEGATAEEIAEYQKPHVPFAVSRRQLRQALVLANIPLANIDYAISQIPDATEKTLMEIYWNDSTEFERNHPKLVEFSHALSISKSQADQLFILASTL